MALQIRRGLEADRAAVTPAEGELLYTTDENILYVGDGTTPGGNIVTGGGAGGLSNVVEDTSPELGGNLDVRTFGITSSSNRNVIISPNGTGKVEINSPITSTFGVTIAPTSTDYAAAPAITSIGDAANGVDGSLNIRTNTYSTASGAGVSFGQAHTTVGVVPVLLYRSRGTISAPTAVTLNDRLGATVFGGHDGSTFVAGASISAAVTGSVSTNSLPTKIVFATNNGTSLAAKAEISETGVLKTNSIANFSGSELLLTATTIKAAGNVQINAQGDLRFADSDSSNYVGFQAPTTISSNVVWTLPSVDGGAGEVLTTDGAGTLSWATGGGGSGLTSRSTLPAVTTGSLADGASEDIAFSGYKGYVLYKIQTSEAAWVRLYTSVAARTADASRLEGTDPLPGSGVVAEIITTGAETILISPGAIGFSSEASPSSSIPCTVTNKAGVSTTITVTVTALQLEV